MFPGQVDPNLNTPTAPASHLFQNAEDSRVLGIVVKTYPIAMLPMQVRRYMGTSEIRDPKLLST
jgi:hypothetical protein